MWTAMLKGGSTPTTQVAGLCAPHCWGCWGTSCHGVSGFSQKPRKVCVYVGGDGAAGVLS